jgi:hydroxypyruvate isomerase
MKFAAHLDTMLGDLSVEDRLRTFSELNIAAAELWCWWDYDLNALVAELKANNLKPSAICTRFISLVDRSCHDAYLEGLGETIEASRKIGSKIIISQVGDELPDISRDEQKQALIDGLSRSAKLLEGTDLILAAEPLNLLVDHAGYFLSRSDEAAEIIRAVDSPNVRMLYDIYHQQITEGDLIRNIRKYADLIAHYHLADHPGRHEPGTGEINYHNVLQAIRDTGYRGYVGLEYWPSTDDHRGTLERVINEYAS